MILTACFGSTHMSREPSLQRCQVLVENVARAGVDAALFLRSPGPEPSMLDALPLIAALASLPVRIGLGASVPIEYTEPFHLARTFAALDRLTKGRSAAVVDLAASSDCAAQCGRGVRKTASHARAAEFLEVTTKLWDSWEDEALLIDRSGGLFTDPDKIHRIEHDGPYFSARGPLNAPRPLQGWPVLIIPVSSPAASEVAAQIADVALVNSSSLMAAQSTCMSIRGKAAAHGRRLQAVKILVNCSLFLGRTEPQARRLADAHPACGDSLRLIGTPEQCAREMREWVSIDACDGFNLTIPEASIGTTASAGLLTDCLDACARPHVPGNPTLRQRLGMPRAPNQFAA
jgi:N-acetyl-S-(2-succino)cysteine monooxygenase